MPIDLIFTDVVMPGPMRSPELARKAKERLPNVAVLFTSGYTDNAIVHGGRLDEGIELLSKPYTREALAWKIRHVLRNAQQKTADAPVVPLPWAVQPEVSPPDAPPVLRILLVEDDALIRLCAVDMLEGLGHSVAAAATASDAMALLTGDSVDVLLTDVGLPDVSGVEVAIQARRMQPELRVVFATGSDAVPGMNGSRELTGAVLLQKPYDQRGLARALSESERPTRP